MTFRRTVRKAIQSGSTVHATVESYALGYATVRLATNGARLTNLSTQGAIVTAGDKVIVDYSAGVKPVVRPLFIPTYEPDTLEVDTGNEVIYMDEDWSCAVTATHSYGYGLDPSGNESWPYFAYQQFIPMATPYKIQWADNSMWFGSYKEGDTVEYFDTAEGASGMYNENNNYGQNYLEIQRTGRYYITGRMEWDDIRGNRTTGLAELDGDTWYIMNYDNHPQTGEPKEEFNHEGYFWIGISINDVIVAKVTNRSTEFGSWTYGGIDGPYMFVNAIEWCNYGDLVSLVVWENNSGPYYWPGYGFPSSGRTDSNGLSAAYIPGSERAIYQGISSQSAYMNADARSAPAYTIGTYDGWTFAQSAYLRGGFPAGGEDLNGFPRPGSHQSAYLEGE